MKAHHYRLMLSVAIVMIVAPLSQPSSAQDAGALQRELQLQTQKSKSNQKPADVPAPKPAEAAADEQKIDVKGYKFKGNSLISEADLLEAVKPWSNRPISFNDLKDVVTAVQERYSKRGYLGQASVPPQDIEDGLVLIDVIEAKLGGIIVEAADPNQALRVDAEMIRLYFGRTVLGTPYIDTKPIESTLGLVNDLPGVRATGEFEAGNTSGESNFRVKLSDSPLFTGQVALSNYGAASTGVEQVVGNLAMNDPSGIGDQVTLDLITSRGSVYSQLGYTLPVGYAGWRLGAQGSYLQYQTLSSFSTNQSTGIASTMGINAVYPLLRESDHVIKVRFGLESRGYSNSEAGANISNYQILAFSTGINGSWTDTPKSLVSYGLTATFGNLTINNQSQAASDASGPATAGDYLKVAFNATRTQELEWLPDTSWVLSASGQWANTNLNSSEQIYMGGPYAVRAYPVSQGGGSQGVILSNELQYKYNEFWQLGAFVDLGYVQQYTNLYPNWQGLTNASNGYYLAAIGPTAKFTYQNWVVNGAVAFRVGDNPLYNSSGQQLNVDSAYRGVQGWIRATYPF